MATRYGPASAFGAVRSATAVTAIAAAATRLVLPFIGSFPSRSAFESELGGAALVTAAAAWLGSRRAARRHRRRRRRRRGVGRRRRRRGRRRRGWRWSGD